MCPPPLMIFRIDDRCVISSVFVVSPCSGFAPAVPKRFTETADNGGGAGEICVFSHFPCKPGRQDVLPANKVLQKPPAETATIHRGRRMGILRITAFIAGPSDFARVRRPAALTAKASGRLTLAMETGPQDFGKKELYCVLCDMKCRGGISFRRKRPPAS